MTRRPVSLLNGNRTRSRHIRYIRMGQDLHVGPRTYMWGIVDMRVIVVMILQELETAQTRTKSRST